MTTSGRSADREPVSAEPMNGRAAPTPWDWVRGPYDVYQAAPERAYGLAVGEPVVATRWRFQEPDHGAVGR
jgi:hypothetical protein